MLTLFVELGTEGALDVLATLMAELQTLPSVHHLQLLHSAQQPGLYLLVVSCSHEPDLVWPAHSKRWMFQTVAHHP
jgi:hypothetical protein